MVDRKAGARTGAVKQDKTYVRAGSKLESRKNSMQVVLSKGATVEIIGEADGFYQIKPPNGATLFISKQFVKPVDAAMRTGLIEKHKSNPEPVAPSAAHSEPQVQATGGQQPQTGATLPPAEPGRIQIPADKPNEPPQAASSPPQSNTTTPSANPNPTAAPTTPNDLPANSDAAVNSSEQPTAEPPYPPEDQPTEPKPAAKTKSKQLAKKSEPAASTPPATGRYRAMLTLVEGELVDMSRRPIDEQDYASLLKKYQPIADQKEESIPAQIAAIRIRQMNDRAGLKLARADIDKDEKSLADLHANMDKERIKIMNRRVDAAMVKYDLEGELRESFAFAPENRRYRLVDPGTKVTTAYVDIPTAVDVNPQHLIGQFVGIRTSGKKFSPSARVPIAVAAEVVDLSPRKGMGDAAMRHATIPVEPASNEAANASKNEADSVKHAAAPIKENLPPPLNEDKPAENAVRIQPPKQPAEPTSDDPEPTSDAGEKAQP
jgi:hypothetical protein